MQALTRSRATIGAAALVGLACAEPKGAREAATVADSSSATPTTALAPWYRGVRTLDLTGDGTADSIRLEAAGTRPDSLRVVLSLVVGGEEKHREEWRSSDELTLVDSAFRKSAQAEPLLRVKLDSVLASVRVVRLDSPGVRLMAEDSAILSGLVPRPTQRVSFSYGYESTARLVWDAPRSRFVRLWSCC